MKEEFASEIEITGQGGRGRAVGRLIRADYTARMTSPIRQFPKRPRDMCWRVSRPPSDGIFTDTLFPLFQRFIHSQLAG